MKTNLRLVVPGLVGIALASTIAFPAGAQTQEAAMTVAKPAATLGKSTAQASDAGTTSTGTAASLSSVVDPNDQTTKERVAHLTAALKRRWERAVGALPSFCQEWEGLLHQREENNLEHLQWHELQGYDTATYVGYGKILGCKAKESEEGVPIGKVVYEEKDYYLSGKTPQEAKAHPQLRRTVSTLEIFSWDKDRWFY